MGLSEKHWLISYSFLLYNLLIYMLYTVKATKPLLQHRLFLLYSLETDLFMCSKSIQFLWKFTDLIRTLSGFCFFEFEVIWPHTVYQALLGFMFLKTFLPFLEVDSYTTEWSWIHKFDRVPHVSGDQHLTLKSTLEWCSCKVWVLTVENIWWTILMLHMHIILSVCQSKRRAQRDR